MSEINSIVRKRFSNMLKRERIRLGLTQQEFTTALGFKIYQLLIKYENCEIVNIPLATFEKFSEVTGIPFDDVIKEAYCGIENKNLEKNKTYNIFSIIDEKDLVNLIEQSKGNIGETLKNIKYALQIAALFVKLPLVRKQQIHESILRELFLNSEYSQDEKNKYLEQSKNVYKKWSQVM